jgi:hypothetical protein
LHKGALSFFQIWYFPAGFTSGNLLFTTSGEASLSADEGQVYSRLRYNAADNIGVRITIGGKPGGVTTGTSFGSVVPSLHADLPGLFIHGFASDGLASGNTYTAHLNGTNYTSGSQTAKTAATGASPSKVQFGSIFDDSSVGDVGGKRLFAMAVWKGTRLTADSFTVMYEDVRSRYGL